MKKRLKSYLTKLEGKRLNMLYKITPERAVEDCLKHFVTPQKRGLSAEQEAFLKSAQKESVQVDDDAIQVYVWPGGEKKILLAHGWESNAARWKDLIQLLQQHKFTVIGLDAPAHGESTGKFYEQNRYGKAIRKIVEKYAPQYAVGHSLGGFTLMLEQYRRPIAGIEKMVFMGAPSNFFDVRDGFQKNLGLNPKLMQAFERYFKNKYGYNLSEFTFLEAKKGFSIPTLFVHDREDRIVDYQPTAQLARQWKNAKLHLTKGFGHRLKDKSIYTVVMAFLKTE